METDNRPTFTGPKPTVCDWTICDNKEHPGYTHPKTMDELREAIKNFRNVFDSDRDFVRTIRKVVNEENYQYKYCESLTGRPRGPIEISGPDRFLIPEPEVSQAELDAAILSILGQTEQKPRTRRPRRTANQMRAQVVLTRWLNPTDADAAAAALKKEGLL